MTKPIGTVRSDLELEDRIQGIQVRERFSNRSVLRQDQKTFGVIGETKFLWAAEHAFTFNAPQFAHFDLQAARKDSSRKRQGDFVADNVVFRAANDPTGLPGSVINIAYA